MWWIYQASRSKLAFLQLPGQIEAHDPGFAVHRSATWHRKDVPQLIANLRDAIPSGRNETVLNLTCPPRDLGSNRTPGILQISRSPIGHQPPVRPTERKEKETAGEGAIIENIRDLNSNIQTKYDNFTMECQI
jgi:hypothetical protein